MPLGVRQRHEGGAITSAPLRWALDRGPHPHAQQVLKGSGEPLAPIPLDRSKFRENGSQPCPNPACDGHSNESIGDECVYCATNERQNTLYLWLRSTPFRSSLGDIGHGED